MPVYGPAVEDSIKEQLVARIVTLEDLLRKEREEHEQTKQDLLKATNDVENATNDLVWASVSNKQLRVDRRLVAELARSEQKQLQDHLNDSFKTIERLRESQYQLNQKIQSLENFDKDKEIQRLKSELEEAKKKMVPESEVQKRLKEEVNDVRSMMEAILLRESASQAFYEGRISEQQRQIQDMMDQGIVGDGGQVVYQEEYPETVEQYPGQYSQEPVGQDGWVQPCFQQQPLYVNPDDVYSENSSGSWQVENMPRSGQSSGQFGAAEDVENNGKIQ